MLALISLSLIAAGLLADFITNVVWFSRIDPWFRYGTDSQRGTYSSTCVSFLFSLIGFLAVAGLIISFFFIKPIFQKAAGGTIKTILSLCVIVALSVISIIASIVSSSYGLREQYSYDEDDYEYYINYKCYLEFSTGVQLMKAYATVKGKEAALQKWYLNLYKKIVKYKYNDGDYDDGDYGDGDDGDYGDYNKYRVKPKQYGYELDHEYTNYLCAEVGAPSLVFAIVQIIGLVLLSFAILTSAISPESNDSINEDDDRGNDVEKQPNQPQNDNNEPAKQIDENENSD